MAGAKKRVVIVGGGFAGLTAAFALSSSFDVVLVDAKPYFEHIPVAPRSLVVPAFGPKTLVDFPSSLNYRQGLLTGLASDGTKGTATLQGGETLEFDYAILATGSTYPAGIKPPADAPTDRKQRLAQFSQVAEKIAAAGSVVVVGGGSVGVEVAAEVAEAHPGKKVTLVALGGLLDRLDAQVQDYAAAWLKDKGVEVLLGERISDWGGLGDGLPAAATLTTASGKTIAGDVVIKCVGVKPATAAYAASLAADQLVPGGALAVEPTLQVKGWANVFAAGDCTNTPEEKTAAYAGVAASVAAANLAALDAGRELQTYPEGLFGAPAPPLGGVSLGSKQGAFQMGSDVQLGAGPAKIKGLVFWIYTRVAAGSRFWGWLYSGMRSMMVTGMRKEAQKAAAAGAADAPAAA